MSIPINTSVVWRAGNSPIKGGIHFSGTLYCTQSGMTANCRLQGTARCELNATGPRNVWRCSDFAAFTKGDVDLASYGRWYYDNYKAELPFGGSAPTGDIIMEYEIDTWRGYGQNSFSLWTNNNGYLVRLSESAGDHYYNIDIPFSVNLTGAKTQTILGYNTSGAYSTTDHGWLVRNEWSILAKVQDLINSGDIVFDYRPGETLSNGSWKSHNRSGGVCERLNGNWYEMRTQEGGTANNDPPERKVNGTWVSQQKIGAE